MTTPTFQQLLGQLHRGGAWAYWWTADASGNDRPRSHWWPVDRPPLPLPDDEQHNVYFGVHPCRVRRRDRQRATIATIAAINCLYAEFDAVPGAKPALLEQLHALAPAPSVIIDSGGGYHLYWLLDQPFALADDAARERARVAQYAWVGYTGGDPAARDLARVLRVPGTINYKPSYAPDYPPVTIVAADFSRTYALEALEEAAAAFLRPAEPALHACSPPSSFADLDDPGPRRARPGAAGLGPLRQLRRLAARRYGPARRPGRVRPEPVGELVAPQRQVRGGRLRAQMAQLRRRAPRLHPGQPLLPGRPG